MFSGVAIGGHSLEKACIFISQFNPSDSIYLFTVLSFGFKKVIEMFLDQISERSFKVVKGSLIL